VVGIYITCVIFLPEISNQNLIMKKQTNSKYGIYSSTNASNFSKDKPKKRRRHWALVQIEGD